MIRDDLSNKLVHLVRGDTIDDAFGKFQNILKEGRLKGGTGKIKGSFTCVCFTEAPIGKLGLVLANPTIAGMRYRPLGIMVDKTYVFEQGGRPAIYQPEDEYEMLPEAIRYRHVCYRPTGSPPVDFTWEREWRLHAEELPLHQATTTVIVPNRNWRDALVDLHTEEIKHRVAQKGSDAAQDVTPYPWHLIVLEDLGIPIPDGIS